MNLPSWLTISTEKLNATNSTNYKTVAAIRLWVGTYVVWAVCQIANVAMQEGVFIAWISALVGLSGVTSWQYKAMRDTDYGLIERKAKAEDTK